MTKHPRAWSLRNVARFSAGVGMGASLRWAEWVRAIVSRLRRCVGWTGRRAHASRKSWLVRPIALEGGLAMPSFADHAASRRKFLQFLAGSPLWAAGALEAFAGEGFAPGSKLPDPLMWAPMRADDFIKSPKEAINVFDFEPVCRKNVPPAHFGYMASGIDDEVTLRANREGFLKFQLRPRRLVDVSKVDMSTEILGVKYNTPIFLSPSGGHKGYHPDGEIGVASAAKTGDHLMILSTQATTSVKDVIAARGKPIWSQLYATNKFEVAKHHIQSMERQGSIAVA